MEARVHGLLVVALVALPVLAQVHHGNPRAGTSGGAATRMQPPPSGMPTLPRMRELESMLGTWTIADTFHPSDIFSRGGSGAGMALIQNKRDPNTLLEYFTETSSPMGKYSGSSGITYDESSEFYRRSWCVNLRPCNNAMFLTGQWRGDDLVFTGTAQVNGKTLELRQTLRFSDEGFTWTEEAAAQGEAMQTTRVAKYTKPNPQPAAPTPR